MIIIEMIDSLAMFEGHIVDIANSGSPFEIIVRRPDIFILKPAFFKQSSSELAIASFNNENSLIETHSIFAFPCLKIDNFLFFLELFLINLILFIVMHLFLLLFLAGACGSDLAFCLVF